MSRLIRFIIIIIIVIIIIIHLSCIHNFVTSIIWPAERNTLDFS